MKDYNFNPNIYRVVSKNIKKYCEEKNISLNTLALEAKVIASKINYIENKDKSSKLSINDLYRISEVLNVNISKFFIE